MPIEISTAENLSNLAWLVFAAASLLLWRQWLQPQLGGRSRRSFCALLSVLLLMFPIISISDDLHPDLVAAVECESKSRLLKPVDTTHRVTGFVSHVPLCTLTSAACLVGPAAVIPEQLPTVVVPVRLRFDADSPSLRGPPPTQLS